ncbi:MAG: UDP-glucose/GDP-mannose dehydrogenase family protein [Deltaproteobacteria bacterium]|nr:UDP-glucose/GDP-mannose dehydrogenase family protein [Deltaproteobacteria bacterium]
MDLAVIGTGYVGLVAGTCFAEMGHNVVCIDRDVEKIRILESGGVPIYEPRLKEMIAHNVGKKRLRFSTELAANVAKAEVIFIAVGTPEGADGRADISAVKAVAREIGQAVKGPCIVVNKSTVPVGTAQIVRGILAEETDIPVDVVSNPEFMKEGAAVDDFMKPDRIVVGTDSEVARDVMTDLYAPFNRTSNRMIFMDTPSAEMTKYVSNCMLATRISFMNEIAALCERLGADVNKVRLGVGSDPRVGPSFLFPGVGYGGSCFPKDVSALIKIAEDNGMKLHVLSSVDEVNDRQKTVMVDKIVQAFGPDLTGLTFGVWGLAFKPNTDDMREAPALRIIDGLMARGAKVKASDPEANTVARGILGDAVEIVEDQYEALAGADALVVVTEWNEFRRPDFKRLKELLKTPRVFDGRNIFNPDRMRSMGFEYVCIGRP